MRATYLLLFVCFFIAIDDAHAGRKRTTPCVSQETGAIKIRKKCRENETVLDGEAISNLAGVTTVTNIGYTNVVREFSGTEECKGGITGKDCSVRACCDPGFTLISGGASSDQDIEASYPVTSNCWLARTFAAPFQNVDFQSYALCAR